MKPVLALIFLALLGACASPNDAPPVNPGPTQTEIKARDDFAKSLPKPSDR
jgi:hypothetical protein